MILDLTGVAHGGFAVGRSEGKVYFVAGGIPGETVRVELTREERRFSYARVVEVIEASPERVPHVWPHAELAGVGGADLGHVSIAGQRRWKAGVIADCLRRIAKGSILDEALNAAGPITVEGYSDGTRGTRTRVGFVADDDGRPAMRRASSHEIVAITEMPLALQELAALDLFSGAWRLVPGETIKAVLPSDSEPVLVANDGVWAAPGVSAPAAVRERVLASAGEYAYELHAGGFWQAHVDAPAVLLDAVIEGARLGRDERVLELFSGAGLFTKALAERAARITAVEGDRGTHEDARRNVPGGNVTQLKASVTPRTIEGKWDVVVLDPPRDGAGLPVARALAGSGARTIVYVACDPAAMARDLAALSPAYEIAGFRALDLFEHTHHVECVAVLERRA